MNLLLEKYNDYMCLAGCKVIYELDDGTLIQTKYDKRNFLHLLGVHKIQDIQLVQLWTDRNNKTVRYGNVISKIKKEELTDADLRASKFFPLIKERYEAFNYDNLTTLNYTDAIVDFNAALIGSVLKGDYILFEERPSGEYNHMSIALDPVSGERYVESFFHQTTTNYLYGQTIVKISKFTILDVQGNVIVHDEF